MSISRNIIARGLLMSILLSLPFPSLAEAAVAFDVGTESHTGTAGDVSHASFSWGHPATGKPAGILVYTINHSNTNEDVTAVTYGGRALTAVSGGSAVDT